MKPCLHRRSAFTLIELIVVLSIIALLAALTVSAVFRLREGQNETNTNKHLLKIQMGLDQQWKAMMDRISAEPVPDLIYELTKKPDGTRDVPRAKALHLKLRLRQEFPQNYAEARFLIPPVNGMLTPQQAAFLNQTYGPKPLYLAAIGNGNGTPVTEAAALLVIALSQTRGGANFNIEEAGPVQQIDVGGKLQRVMVDSWGNPICLRRWATDVETDAINELNQPPFISPTALATGNRDPQDPEGRLRLAAGATWGFPPNGPNYRPMVLLWFTTPLPMVAEPFDCPPAMGNGNLNRGPYVVSSGKNGNFMDPDDLYSFRLQREGKGN
jgi:prepilin-type N-terminal cleavage/methylation domain-containing protein